MTADGIDSRAPPASPPTELSSDQGGERTAVLSRAVAGKAAIRILMLEDLPTDAELAERALRRGGIVFTSQRVDTRDAFVDALESFKPDVVLLDYSLPDYDGRQALLHLRATHPELPAVMVTGALGEEAAIELLHGGAKDYVLKTNLIRLVPAVERAISVEQGTRARKAAERALRRSEEELRTLLAATVQWVWKADAAGRVTEDVPAWRALTGRTADELLGDGWMSALHPDDREPTIEGWRKAVQAGTSYESEYRIRRHDGAYRYLEIRAAPVLNEDGAIRGWIGSAIDVTERREAETALHESEAKFRSLVETTSDVIWEYDANVRFTYLSPQVNSVYGYAPGELIGKSAADIVMEEQRPQIAAFLEDRFAKAEPFALLETRCRRPDGREISVEVSGAPFFDGAGRLAGYRGVTRDVTARKDAENKIREEEAKFRALVEQNIAGTFIIRDDGTIGYVNPYFAELFGYTPAEVIGRPLLDFIPEEERASVGEAVREHLSGGADILVRSSLMQARDGRRIDVMINATRSVFEGRTASIAVVLDITELHKAERELAQNAAILATEHEVSLDGILVVDPQGQMISLNRRFIDMWGISPEIVASKSDARAIESALGLLKDPEYFVTSTKRLYDHPEEKLHDELDLVDDRTFERYSAPMPRPQGGYSGRVFFFRDITERKRAEQEVRDANIIIEQSPVVLFRALAKEGFPRDYVSHNIDRFGYTAEEAKAGAFAFPDYIHPDDRAAALEALGRLLRGESELFEMDYRAVTRDGSIRWIHDRTAPLRDQTGKVWAYQGILIDITDRRYAEENLRASEERFRLLVEDAPDAILLYDADQDCFTTANLAAEKLFACPRDELLKRGPPSFYTSEQPDRRAVPQSFAEHNRQVLAGQTVVFERRICNAAGEDRLCEVTLVRLPAADRRLLRLSYIDITERKEAARALERLNRALRTLSRGNEIVIRAVDETTLMNDMCRSIVETGGYRTAWIGRAQHDAAKSVTPISWAGEIGQYLEKAQITWADEPRGNGPHGRAIRSGQPQITQHLRNDPSMAPWLEEAERCGFAASAALPLKDASGTFAVLMIYAAEPDAFDPDELKLLTELAGDLAFGIQALRNGIERDMAVRRWRASLQATITTISNTVEMRDPYTAGHQRRVAQLAVAIARELGLAEHDVEGLDLAASIHDVGKINTPAEILNKPGKLSALELQLIKGHAQSGYDLLKGIDFPWPIAQVIWQHHERLDGSGYPQGLNGDMILPEAKILAVADVVEAMMSHRPYRPQLGIEAALAEIEKGKGQIYDPAAVDACIALFRDKGFSFDQIKSARG